MGKLKKPRMSAKAKGLTTQSDRKERLKSGDHNPLKKTEIIKKKWRLRKIK